MKRAQRIRLVQSLLATASRSGRWRPDPSLPAEERIGAVLAAVRLEVETEAVVLRARIDESDGLTIAVAVRQGWSRIAEAELYDALVHNRSPLAEIVLLDWPAVRDACAAAADRELGADAVDAGLLRRAVWARDSIVERVTSTSTV